MRRDIRREFGSKTEVEREIGQFGQIMLGFFVYLGAVNGMGQHAEDLANKALAVKDRDPDKSEILLEKANWWNKATHIVTPGANSTLEVDPESEQYEHRFFSME